MRVLKWAQEHRAQVLFIGLLLLSTTPIWFFEYFVTTDGPSHLYNAKVLAHLLTSPGDIFSGSLEINWASFPNWTSHIFLALVGSLVGFSLAEKLMLMLILWLPLVGFQKILGQERGQWIYLLALPIFWSKLFYMGFFNFQLSVGLALWLIALLTKEDKGKRWAFIWPSLLAVVLFYTHPMGLLWAAMVFLLHTGVQSVASESRKEVLRTASKKILSLLPALVLFLWYMATKERSEPIEFFWDGEIKKLWLFKLDPLVSLMQEEENYYWGYLLLLVLGLLLVLISAIVKKRLRGFVWLAVAAITAFGYYLFPDDLLGGGMLLFRLFDLSLLALLLWIGSNNIVAPMVVKPLLATATILLTFLLHVSRWEVYSQTNRIVGKTLDAGELCQEKGSLLSLIYEPGGVNIDGPGKVSLKNWLFRHTSDYIAIQKDLLHFNNYEANKPYFPLRWKPQIDPYFHLCENKAIEALPPQVNIPAYEAKTGLRVDYVFCYGVNFTQGKVPPFVLENFDTIFNAPDYDIQMFARKSLAK